MGLLSLLKTKAWAIGAAVLAAILGLLKIQTMRANSWKNKAKKHEESLKAKERQAKLDEELEQDFSDFRRAAEKDLDEGNIPEHLRRPRD